MASAFRDVAVCIAGAARTFHMPEVYAYLKVEVVDALRADAFGVLVYETNATAPQPRWFQHPVPGRDKRHTPSPRDRLELPTKVLGFVQSELLPFGSGWMQAVLPCTEIRTEPEQECHGGQMPPGGRAPGIIGLAATATCHRMVTGHERSRGQRYRWLVRARPDVVYLWTQSYSPLGGFRGLRKRFDRAAQGKEDSLTQQPVFLGCRATGGKLGMRYRHASPYTMSHAHEGCISDNIFALSRDAADLFFGDELLQPSTMQRRGCADWWRSRNEETAERLLPGLTWCGRITECLVTLLVTRSNLTFDTWCPVERFVRDCDAEFGRRRSCDRVPMTCVSPREMTNCGAKETGSYDVECAMRTRGGLRQGSPPQASARCGSSDVEEPAAAL